MKTNNRLSAYILRGSTAALLFSCVIVALCSAIHLPETTRSQDNAGFGANGSLSFADRVAYQTAIEDVYWRHRIWPKTNAGAKLSLDMVMSQTEIEKKVEDYLHNSQALEDYWHRPASNASHPPAAMQQLRAGNDVGGPITADQLQAEMERMAKNTKQPEVLQELFEALGNDPFVIAECLARPILAERFLGELSSGTKDASFRAESRMERLGEPQHGREGRSLSERKISESNAAARPRANSTGSFDSAQDDIAANLASAAYTLPVIASPSAGCIDDTWTATTLMNAPAARYYHTAVWTGSEMIVWGGRDGPFFNTGGRYNPSTDSWTRITTTNAPEARIYHTAVWTGSEMIVWGGLGSGLLNTGGRYNPGTDTWTTTDSTNAPDGRAYHTAVWTDSEMIVWGGCLDPSCSNPLSSGGRYNPSTDSWTPTSSNNAPSARGNHAAVWTEGGEMIVWGGIGAGVYFNTGGRYHPGLNSWTATSTTNAPAGRYHFTAVWTGTEMLVWGGFNPGSSYLNTGSGYNPSTDSWTAICTTNPPDARSAHTAVWTGSEMIIWGGIMCCPTPLNTGGRSNSGTDCWTATSLIDAPDARYGHTAVWTGTEMIVWGGTGDLGSTNTGGKYCATAGGPTPTPTATATATAAATATATPTATLTPSPTPTPGLTPRATPMPRLRPTPAPRP